MAGKKWEAAKMPIIILVIWGIISMLVGFYMPELALIGLISWLIMIWAGYNAVKKFGLGLVDAGVSTAIAAVVAGIINMIIMYVLIAVGLSVTFDIAGGMLGAMAGAMMVVALIVGIIIGAIIGFILGAIGALIAGGKK